MMNVRAALAAATLGAGMLISTIPALADNDSHRPPQQHQQSDRGNHNGWSHQGTDNGRGQRDNDHRWADDRRNRNDNDRDDNGRYRGYNNGGYNNGGYNNGGYNNGGYNNGGYNNGGYNNGSYNNGSYNNGGYNSGGNARISGTIVGVNGSQVSIRQGYSRTITIDDQPALDNQSSGRVYVGRNVTAYGYVQNGVFYATQMI